MEDGEDAAGSSSSGVGYSAERGMQEGRKACWGTRRQAVFGSSDTSPRAAPSSDVFSFSLSTYSYTCAHATSVQVSSSGGRSRVRLKASAGPCPLTPGQSKTKISSPRCHVANLIAGFMRFSAPS